MKFFDDDDVSGQAADTGSAVHFAARVFHKEGKGNLRLSVGAMRESVKQFPLADLDVAEAQFQCYATDPRNTGADFVFVEKKITFTLAPTAEDPTQKEIVVTGTLDQLRRAPNGVLYLWDIKTGAPQGVDMLADAAMQLAGYQYGAGQLLGEVVRGAGIIRTRDYLKTDRSRKRLNPGPVFYEAPWSHLDVEAMLDVVRQKVADVRAGRITIAPGEGNCKWCIGVGNCVPRKRAVDRIQLGLKGM